MSLFYYFYFICLINNPRFDPLHHLLELINHNYMCNQNLLEVYRYLAKLLIHQICKNQGFHLLINLNQLNQLQKNLHPPYLLQKTRNNLVLHN